MLNDVEIARRLPLWWALSDLLLDTDMPHVWGPYIVRTMREGGFALGDAHEIFLDEVGPAFYFNLSIVTGEWAGWEEEYVRRMVVARLRRPAWMRRIGERSRRATLQDVWDHTLPYVQAALAELDAGA